MFKITTFNRTSNVFRKNVNLRHNTAFLSQTQDVKFKKISTYTVTDESDT